MKDYERIVVEIAGIVFGMSSDQPKEYIRLEKAYRHFLSSKKPEVIIHAHYDGLPSISLRDEERVFDSEMVWSLYRTGGLNVFVFKSLVTGSQPFRIAIFSEDFRRGDVYNRWPNPEWTMNGLVPSLLEFPLSEVVMMCLLARERGLMIHACGIENKGQGYLFTGNSTHGKSTMARLWKDRATILNDDRIVLRRHNGRFWMYGTPWHGDYNGVSPQGVPLGKIFFLHHGKVNSSHRKEGADAPAMLLARCFPPLWDAEGMRFTLNFCAQVTESVPCYELSFVPNGSIVDFIQCME